MPPKERLFGRIILVQRLDSLDNSLVAKSVQAKHPYREVLIPPFKGTVSRARMEEAVRIVLLRRTQSYAPKKTPTPAFQAAGFP
jgi:hypothetical protein